jgi:hypothetical protein
MTTNNTENAGGVTQEDREAAHSWLRVSPLALQLSMSRPHGIYEAFAKHRIAARQAAMEEVRADLPDEIDLFRAIRDAGRKNSDKARAAYALIPQALRILSTPPANDREG